MTVNQSQYVTDLQLYDIASIQWLYGRNDDYHSLTDTYAWYDFLEASPGGLRNRYFSIWDGGGEDRISAAADPSLPNLAAAAFIDLRPGHFSSLGNGTLASVANHELLSTGVQNVSIAFGAVIENATGTDNNDAIIGNVYANEIDGGKGDDMLFGSGSAVREVAGREAEFGIALLPSSLDTDDGDYRKIGVGAVVASTAPAEATVTDEIHGGDGNDFIASGDGPSKIYGDAGNDILVGGGGDDQFFGGSGNDKIWGDGGSDTADYSDGATRVIINYDGNSATPVLTVDDGTGGTDSLHSIEKVVGTTGRDLVVIKGQILAGTQLEIDANGGQGADPRDTVNSKNSTGIDVKIELDGTGYIANSGHNGLADPRITLTGFHTGIIGSDFDDTVTDLSSGHKTIDAGEGNNTIEVGGSGARVMGRSGDDTIHGSQGNDVLIGGGGADSIDGGDGNDFISENSGAAFDVSQVLNGGDGIDWIDARGSSKAVITGGAGDDTIVITATYNATVNFTAGDGHDSIVAGRLIPDQPAPNITINLGTLSAADCTLIWDYTATLILPPSGMPVDTFGMYQLEGPAALRVNATGDTIYLGILYGESPGIPSNYPELDGDPVFTTNGRSFDGFTLNFADGVVSGYEPEAAGLTIAVADPGQYDVAPAEFQADLANDVGNTSGTGGNDTLEAGGAGGSISAGNGDDTIYAGHGAYAIDGGSGDDVYDVFGAFADYSFQRDGDTLVVTSLTGFEGEARLTNVESVFFDTEVASLSVAQILATFSTSGNDIVTGTPWHDYLDGQAGNDIINGGGGDDTLSGGDGDDVLDGDAGSDYLQGGEGSDTYIVGDLLTNGGQDVVYDGGAGTDVDVLQLGEIGSLPLLLRADDNGLHISVAGYTHEVSVDGQFDTAGVEQITFERGGVTTTLDRTDIANLAYTSLINGSGDPETLTGTTGRDAVYGDAGNDTLNGLGGNDWLDGGDGNDVLDGGTGNDVMVGGAGNDSYQVDSASDVVVENAGEGSDTVNTAILSYSLPANVENLTYTGTGNATLTGTSADNILTGAGGNDYFDLGQGGIDTANGGGGNDAFAVGATFSGADRIDGGAGTSDQIGLLGDYTGSNALVLGANTIVGVEVITALAGFSYNITTNDGNVAAGQTLAFYATTLTATNAFTFNGAAETDGKFLVYGGLGTDTITTGAGSDGIYFGRDGRFNTVTDHVDGGGGSDQMALDGSYTVTISSANIVNVELLSLLDGTAATHAVYNVTLADDWTAAGQTHTVYGVQVRDGFTVDGSGETDGHLVVYGGLGNDSIQTGAGNDTVFGGAGNDTIATGNGNDTIYGGAGDDTIDGGSGTDTAQFAGALSGYQLSTAGGVVSIVDIAPTVNGNDGTDHLVGVENAHFTDQTVSLASPIVLDLDGDGVNLLGKGAGTTFDWDGDGVADRTGWTSGHDGILMLDRNGDGVLNGASELTFVGDKEGARSDLDGLSAFDSNGDGILSAGDARFADFHVWIDGNGNGLADAGELKTLNEAGVASIDLHGTATIATWGWDDNLVVNTGGFTHADGTVGALADVAFNYDSSLAVSGSTLAAVAPVDSLWGTADDPFSSIDAMDPWSLPQGLGEAASPAYQDITSLSDGAGVFDLNGSGELYVNFAAMQEPISCSLALA
jgi:Ca2+-binding RTX toxin-like protein